MSHMHLIQSDYFHPTFPLISLLVLVNTPSSLQVLFLPSCLFLLLCDPLSLIRALCVNMGLKLSLRAWLGSSAGAQMHNRPPFSQHPSVGSSSAERAGASEPHPQLAEDRHSLMWAWCRGTHALWVHDCNGCVTAEGQHFFTALSLSSGCPPFLPQCSLNLRGLRTWPPHTLSTLSRHESLHSPLFTAKRSFSD